MMPVEALVDGALLAVRGLRVEYGAIVAVEDVALRVAERQVVTILGANGAGKTSTLRAIGGLLPPSRGEIWFDGRRIERVGAEDLLRRGLVTVTDSRDLFPRFSVAENLRMGAYSAPVREYTARRDDILDLFPGLQRLLKRPAWTLSGGEQQMLALGRALIARPRLLLLDEPSLGLAPLMVKAIFDALATIARAGTAMLLVEQVSAAALGLAEQAYVMRGGRIVLSGSSAAVRSDPRVLEAYLGGGDLSGPELGNAVP